MNKEKKKIVAAFVAVIISMGILGYQVCKLIIPKESNPSAYPNIIKRQYSMDEMLPIDCRGQTLNGHPKPILEPMLPIPKDPPTSIPVIKEE